MPQVQYARLREGPVTFGVVVVKDHVIDYRNEADNAVGQWSEWMGCPTILLGANRHQLYGRPDIVDFMSNVALSRIPWRRTSI